MKNFIKKIKQIISERRYWKQKSQAMADWIDAYTKLAVGLIFILIIGCNPSKENPIVRQYFHNNVIICSPDSGAVTFDTDSVHIYVDKDSASIVRI